MKTKINNSTTHNPQPELPTGWQWVRLGDVCEINPCRTRHFTRSSNELTTFIPMSSVNGKSGAIIKPEVVPYSKVAKGYTYFEENDVLFAKITPCMQNGKHIIARNLIDGIGFGSTEFHVLRPDSEVLPEWIYFFIRQPLFLKEATSYFTGAVGQQRVPKEFLSDYIIPLAPLSEQKRITSKIQELMQEIDKTRTACEKQLEAAKALPSAYLREVFESEEAKKWERKRLGELCEVVTGNTPSRNISNNYGAYIPWIKPEDLDKEMYISDSKEYLSELGVTQSRVLPAGTVLVSCIGNLGKTAIAGCKLATNQQINSLIPSPQINSEYLYFCSHTLKETLEKLASSTTLEIVNKNIFSSVKIPFPTLAVQQCIAIRLKEKMSEVEKLKTSIEKQLEAINALPQTILRKAFRGEL